MSESVKPFRRLSLAEAQKSGRLTEFIEQEESLAIGPADEQETYATLAALIKAPQSAGQTSHSPSGDGSTDT